MTSRKKSEGIALLSMYGDDEDDEEMEDIEEEEGEEGQEQNDDKEATENEGGSSDAMVTREEGEMESSSRFLFGAELQGANGTIQISTLNVQEALQSGNLKPHQPDTMNMTIAELESLEVEGAVEVSVENMDLLDKFLPPPTKSSCPEELQRRIDKFLALKKNGRSFNAEVRNRKDYRNPDFLLHAVRYQDIDQIGSCFSKDVFDPHGYDNNDYYNEIEIDMKRERERRDQELKRSPRPELVMGGYQPGIVRAGSKFSLPIPGAPVVVSGGLNPALTTTNVVARKSKWDKVGGD
ncbi:hypothetical protein HS088_TW09G00391 [Tripterygium wilfordii]|uniref:SAP30-binding protein n=1 Tax=Tripterygium wilfordii TaxID=458696 RepID=A0A7J7D7M5_TRIWF|nr:SAP30-binding protein-like [Tripterygium wilfordii]KAF5742347.1 hypothetical protein HS088_TW09G00391 [Tripterygium wilfordii]